MPMARFDEQHRRRLSIAAKFREAKKRKPPEGMLTVMPRGFAETRKKPWYQFW
jgi:hypothetical protein